METTGKEEQSLSTLLEQDRERVMTQLIQDRAQESAVPVLEKEVDRLMVQAGALETEQASAAQGMLQVLKCALPLAASVSEAETWEKDGGQGTGAKKPVPVSSIICGAAGIVCVIAGMLGTGLFALLRVLWSAAGCMLLLAAGWLAGRGRSRKTAKTDTQVRQTFLVDPARIWHILQGTLLSADHSLKKAGEYAANAAQEGKEQAAGALKKEDLLFFSELLENAYAQRRRSESNEALSEQVESIRYYLHERGIETEDYSRQSAAWFEQLPSGGDAVTIRPALLKDGVVVMKGVASGG